MVSLCHGGQHHCMVVIIDQDGVQTPPFFCVGGRSERGPSAAWVPPRSAPAGPLLTGRLRRLSLRRPQPTSRPHPVLDHRATRGTLVTLTGCFYPSYPIKNFVIVKIVPRTVLPSKTTGRLRRALILVLLVLEVTNYESNYTQQQARPSQAQRPPI